MSHQVVHLSSFCYLRGRPHTCPLFPYTTLSDLHATAAQGGRRDDGRRRHAAWVRGDRYLVDPQYRSRDGAPVEGPHPRPPGDRKSTRLNSSHVETSYAVFCLKNKIHVITLIALH